MSEELETDYLVVGAGAAGMAFSDTLLAHSTATVTIVDRRHAPARRQPTPARPQWHHIAAHPR
jgi:cation diffusion facilitator CzcD-associated flavoprotein CzcO